VVGSLNGSADGSVAEHQRSPDLAEYVRAEPLKSVTVAAAAGFILGGGLNSRVGLALLAFVGRIALRQMVTGSLVELVAGNHNNGRNAVNG
jgi:hypothetical protein